ncbi:MAG: hypothetical protein OYK82_09935 [Gammaproteobacteria bacterium]|nr:hypothetical protein [Gammaproteobacteria bacterium]
MIERAFRIVKSGLRVQPVYTENHVRGHVFLCLLAYYLEWNMRQRLAPLLFEDDNRPVAEAARGTHRSRRRRSHPIPSGRPIRNGPLRDCRFTDSRRCSMTSPVSC